MNRAKVKNLISLILNIATAALVAFAVSRFFTAEGLQSGIGNMKSGGVYCFNFFTIDSNILAALCSLLIVPFNIRALVSGNGSIPKWVLLLKFVGTTAVTVTLIVVLVFLSPIMGYASMFEGSCFFLHLVCPLLVIASFCFFEQGAGLSKIQALFGVLPTLIYGTVYLINVIFIGVWEDFYHFNIGGFWYISYIVMMAVTYIFALALGFIHNKTEGKL